MLKATNETKIIQTTLISFFDFIFFRDIENYAINL